MAFRGHPSFSFSSAGGSVYVLYYSPGAASFAVHWLLIELGVPFEARRLDLDAQEHKRPEYLKLNPNGLVPTLLIDGKPVYESAALVALLAERHPEAKLSPAVGTAERTTYLQWMFHLSNTLQSAFRTWFYPEGAAGAANIDAAKAEVRPRIEAAWERMGSHLSSAGPMMCGERLSAVDFFATMLMRWSRNMPRPATDWPAIASYVSKMKARPSFRELYAREGLTEWS
jgi:glutathione S-transferase